MKEGDRKAREGRDLITEAGTGVMWPRAKELSFYTVEKATVGEKLITGSQRGPDSNSQNL